MTDQITRDELGQRTEQNERDLMSEAKAAERLGIARITLLRARKRGMIRYYRIARRVLYSDDHLADYLRSCERGRGAEGKGE
jgi:hypothetical protein